MGARAIGATGGLPGYLAGEALSNPAVGRTAEALIRGGATTLARLAQSPIVRTATGPVGAVASMPISEAGDRPAGENMETFRARQEAFAQQARAMGHKVPKTEDVVRQVMREQIMKGQK